MVEVRTANQLKDLKELLTSGGDVSIAVAYLTRDGLGKIRRELQQAINNGRSVKLAIDLHAGITEPDTLKELVELSRDPGNRLGFRAFFDANPMFHSKLYIADRGESISFLTGSFNLTGKAFESNLEHGLFVECTSAEDIGQKTLAKFKAFWDGGAIPTDDQVERYRKSYAKSIENLPNPEAWAAAKQHLEQNYWLFKVKASRYTWKDLKVERDKISPWNGIRSWRGRNYMRDEIKEGARILFYRSSAKPLQVMGTAIVVKEAYHDHYAWDSNSKDYDPKSDRNHPAYDSNKDPKWVMVDIQADQEFPYPVTLKKIKATPELENMMLVKGPTILSIQPVRPEEWAEIVKMGMGK